MDPVRSVARRRQAQQPEHLRHPLSLLGTTLGYLASVTIGITHSRELSVLINRSFISTWHQSVTYWVQGQNSPTPQSGSTVAINDTAPTSDRYNLALIEVLPQVGSGSSGSTGSSRTYSASGAISPVSSGAGTTVTLTGPLNAAVSTDASGDYSFSGLTNGVYVVTPSKTAIRSVRQV